MLDQKELLKIARARMKDAEILFGAKRYDGAAYLCGYVVECALKARIVSTLKWPGFPASKKEFEGYASFKTHNLDILLALSGRAKKVKGQYYKEWSGVSTWDPETRYNPIGSVSQPNVLLMIQRVQLLLPVL